MTDLTDLLPHFTIAISGLTVVKWVIMCVCVCCVFEMHVLVFVDVGLGCEWFLQILYTKQDFRADMKIDRSIDR